VHSEVMRKLSQSITLESTGRSQRAVVYNCNEGIKDLMNKSALTCDLILCPNCEAKRHIEYNKADYSGQQSSGFRRSRQKTKGFEKNYISIIVYSRKRVNTANQKYNFRL
jgi:hypothetical protein